MTDLRIESMSLPAADLGPDNPLPPVRGGGDVHAARELPGVPEDMARNIRYGRVPNCLPYTMQDGYTRALRPRAFRTAVLENDILRATFLLELGGRLWSLVHKPSGRELLDANPVFQPANLALRNAWWSGGVEWNIGTIGHSPFTCSPLFAARVQAPDGAPVLRLYEYERIRRVPFQLDAYLPDRSPVLFVRVRIRNPDPREVPMYWWSNIAVPETPDTRVLVPAESAYKFGYGKDGLALVPIPYFEGTDISYTTRMQRSMDFFFHLEDGQRRWIAALDGAGRGLVQTSTDRLRGRKLFLWGSGAGGRRWQAFLSRPGRAYLEIQAGLARTQLEHLPMPAGAEWSWCEAYGLLETNPAVIHGLDWTRARAEAETRLERLIPRAALEAEEARAAAFANEPPIELVQHGSGWGALERIRREAAGENPLCSPALSFPDASLGEAQRPWLVLLREGRFPECDSGTPPEGYMVAPAWRERLERSVVDADGANWAAWLHLGLMRAYAGEREAACEAWEASLRAEETPWALRNLAVLEGEAGKVADAARLYDRAFALQPDCLTLAIECGRTLLAADRASEWLALLGNLPETVRANGRVRLLEARAALALGDLARVRAFFDERLEIDDLREGERSLSDLWFAYHELRIHVEQSVPVDDTLRERVRREYAVPERFDFRMAGDCGGPYSMTVQRSV